MPVPTHPGQTGGGAPRRAVVIVGGGPAGYAAAIYAARAGLDPLVFEGSQLGGALMNTTAVDNYPGFAAGVDGPDLMAAMRAQAGRFGAELVPDDVVGLDLAGPGAKTVRTLGGETAADAVILSMGSRHRRLGLPGEEGLAGRGVSYCATCDGFFFRGMDVAVVGGGDTAMEEALSLTRFAASVTVVHRRRELRASGAMAARARANPKIGWALGAEVAALRSEGGALSGVLLRAAGGGEAELPVRGLFVAVGNDPRSELVEGQLDLDAGGYIRVDAPATRAYLHGPDGTGGPAGGVFAAGDVADRDYRQAVTAAASGCRAALDAGRYLAAGGA